MAQKCADGGNDALRAEETQSNETAPLGSGIRGGFGDDSKGSLGLANVQKSNRSKQNKPARPGPQRVGQGHGGWGWGCCPALAPGP